MIQKIKEFFYNEKVSGTSRFLFYFIILFLLFFMYGFNDSSAGTYIYNDF